MNIEIIIAIAGIIVSFIAAKLLYFILSKYIKSFTKKTKTDIDDRLLAALERPFVIVVVLIGLYFSLLQIDYVRKHIELMNDVFFVLGVLWAVFVLYRLTKVAMEKWMSVNPAFQNMPKLVVKAANIFVYFIGLSIILKHFNVEITPLVATLGIGGIAIGFALQDHHGQHIAGLMGHADDVAVDRFGVDLLEMLAHHLEGAQDFLRLGGGSAQQIDVGRLRQQGGEQ